MKKTFFKTLGVVTVLSVMMASCGGGSTPKTSLNNAVDSISYAYGVSMAEQGLVQFLEHNEVLINTSDMEYDYQMRIASVDSLERVALEKELKTKLDSINRINAPRLNEFTKGIKDAINLEEKSAYGQGLSIGTQFSQMMLPQVNTLLYGEEGTEKLNVDQLLAGLISVLKKESLAIDAIDAGEIVQKAIEEAQAAETARMDEELKKAYSDVVEEGEAFMAENAKRDGVVTLPSGLQYEVIRAGSGAIPTESDKVRVHYHGTLIDQETVFDSSVDRGEPASFGVTQVIPGWTEALQLMPVGSKWRLYIPYNLAYGSQDRGAIKPFSNLIFDVELLGIE